MQYFLLILWNEQKSELFSTPHLPFKASIYDDEVSFGEGIKSSVEKELSSLLDLGQLQNSVCMTQSKVIDNTVGAFNTSNCGTMLYFHMKI